MSDSGRNTTVAYGDESVRLAADPPVYLVATTVFSGKGDISNLMAVKPKAAGKLHWRDMTDKPKRRSLEAISSLDHSSLIVAAAPLPRKKQERARRKCLEAMLFELESRGVNLLVLESRTPEKNAKDVDLLLSMRAKGIVSAIDLEHARGEEEPRLWVSDQLLGAYGDVLCGSRGLDKWKGEWEKEPST